MDLYAMAQAVEASGIGTAVRDSLYALPVINVLHVIGVALVFGTISIVDLRLLGVPSNARSLKIVSHDLLRWTWAGFGLALFTGSLMAAANATTFYANNEFRLKLVALAFAGVNMMIFELLTARNAHVWDKDVPVPVAGKLAGALSLVFWISVIFLGRWIGYTKGFNFDVPVELDLDKLF
jgi:Ca2+/H+ antiporter